ncbi:MAG: hypothetical protein K8S98_02495 [Planctomycetes bacterium]|nr:hypothetical protein [Planctomycetota bacterium]
MSSPMAVVAAYKFKSSVGESEMWALLREHRATIQAEGLGTAREPWVLQSYTDPRQLLEIFEWKDEAAGRAAPNNPRVFAVWQKFATLCDAVGLSLAKTAEANAPFAHFKPVRL